MYAIRKLYEPEFYQGPAGTAAYFEGWYYKVASENGAFAVIPGVSRSRSDPHAFVQTIDGLRGESSYHRFDLSEFDFTTDAFSVTIGQNRFSLGGMSIALDSLTADLEFTGLTLWRGTALQPGTMGWYSFVPFMQCRHGIIVMDAVARGVVNGRATEGRLYLEKDYGRSFPNAWVWLQTNSFPRDRVSVTCSIANVPFVGGAFTGFLAGMSVDGSVYKFTTYTGSRIVALSADESSVELAIADRAGRRLAIHAAREAGAELRAPQLGEMRGRVVETIRSAVDVELTDGSSVIYSGTGRSAGLEVVNPESLDLRRR